MPWFSPVERAAIQWLGVQPDRLLEGQLILSLCTLLVSAWVALFLMVRAYKKLQHDHANEQLKKPAAVQGGGLVTKRSRADLLRPWD